MRVLLCALVRTSKGADYFAMAPQVDPVAVTAAADCNSTDPAKPRSGL